MKLKRPRRTIFRRAVGGLLLCFLAAWLPPVQAGVEEEEVVATVAGEPIVLGEFLLHLTAQRAGVYAHFQEQNREEDTDRFWETDYGGVTPWAFLKAKALQDLKAVKVQQSAARRAGIVKDTSYAAFQQRWVAENRRRAGAVQAGQVVYGPTHLSEWTFYNEEMARLIRQLKSDLSETALRPSDEEVRQYYERNRSRRYRVPDTVSVEVLTWTGAADSLRARVERALQGVQHRAREGKSLAEGAASSEATTGEMQVFSYEINSSTASQLSKTMPDVWMAATTLRPGQVSELIRSEAGLRIIKCHARQDGGFLPYDRFEAAIRRDCLNERYTAFVDQGVADATVLIDQSVYAEVDRLGRPAPAEFSSGSR